MRVNISNVIRNYCAVFQEDPASRESQNLRNRLEEYDDFTEELVDELERTDVLSAGEADAIRYEFYRG